MEGAALCRSRLPAPRAPRAFSPFRNRSPSSLKKLYRHRRAFRHS
jgi:hypothetical protein